MRTLHRAPRGPVAILRAAMAFSLLAAAHLWVVPEHLEEWWGYGMFFLVLAAAQVVYAFGLLRPPPSRSSCSAWQATCRS